MPEGVATQAACHYDLNGRHIAIEAPEPKLARFFDSVLAPFAAAPGVADWTVRVRLVDALPPPAGELQWQGDLPEGLDAALFIGDDGRILSVPGHFLVRVKPAARLATIAAIEGRTRWLSGTAVFWLLNSILDAYGRHMVHAACLVRPQTDDALLLFAPSGTGKTTTALALARQGWALAGDDASVFELEEGGAAAWALPRAMNLHLNTATLLPWLAPALRDFAGRAEQAIALSALQGLIGLAPPSPRRCAGVILLAPRNAERHRAQPLAKADAAVAIALDNVRRGPSGLDDSAARLFDALTRLIAAVPAIQFSAGPDPATLTPALLEAVLR